jgi:hypothetical protein
MSKHNEGGKFKNIYMSEHIPKVMLVMAGIKPTEEYFVPHL